LRIPGGGKEPASLVRKKNAGVETDGRGKTILVGYSLNNVVGNRRQGGKGKRNAIYFQKMRWGLTRLTATRKSRREALPSFTRHGEWEIENTKLCTSAGVWKRRKRKKRKGISLANPLDVLLKPKTVATINTKP